MKQLLISFTLLLISICCNAQLGKKTWLVGGNASFRTSKYEAPAGTTSKQTIINLNSNLGYFILDKFTVGLKPGYGRIAADDNIGNKDISNSCTVGPFVRYYFLQKENTVNVFSELSYQYGITKTNQGVKQSSNNFHS